MAVTRRQGREWALQMLCQADLNPAEDINAFIDEFWRQQWDVKNEIVQAETAFPAPVAEPPDAPELVAPLKIREFTEARVRGVLADVSAVDKVLEPFLQNWDMYRLGTVERNVLRLGAWELKNCPDVPPPVVINEAVDLAKYFSNAEAGRFVNGILDNMRRGPKVKKPDPVPAPVEEPAEDVTDEAPKAAKKPYVRKSGTSRGSAGKGVRKPGTRKFGAKKPFDGEKKPFGRKPAGGKPFGRKPAGAKPFGRKPAAKARTFKKPAK